MTTANEARFGALLEREAEGESLSASEREFLARYAAENAEAAGALEVLRRLSSALQALPQKLEPGDQELIARVLAQGKALEGQRFRRLAGAGVLTLAAGLAVWFGKPAAPEAPVVAKSLPARGADVVAELAVSGPGVTVSGSNAQVGQKLLQGARLETQASGACLKLASDVRVCLAPRSLAELTHLGVDVVLSVERGAVAADLGPQPPGTSFSLGSRAGKAQAIGTRFGLEVAAATVLRVALGTVEVTGDGPAYRVSGPGRVELGSHQVLALPTRELSALGELLAPLLGPGAPAGHVLPSSSATPGAPPDRSPVAAPAPGASASAESAGELLARAREQRAAGAMKVAARAYRRLISEHPASAEALTARVALGQLELSALSEPASALAHFSEYLRRGGPLEQEARYGQIRALSALSRPADEKQAIAAFLGKYPKAMQAAALRERLKTLGGSSATLSK